MAIHFAAMAAALFALLTLISGALATTASTLTQPFSNAVVSAGGHSRTGEILGTLIIVSLLFVAVKDKAARGLAFALCAIVAMQAFVAGLLHATMGQVLLAGTAGVVIATAPSWKGAPEHVGDYGWPSLRSLGALLPFLVLTQVALGAAYRQRVMGLMPHIVGAIFVSLIILIVCAFTLQQCPTHKILRAAAQTLMVFTFTQVFLGISAFTVRMMPNATAAPVLAFTGGHVTVGALTLAASVVLSMQIRRNMLPKSVARTPAPAPSSQSSDPRQQG